MLKDWQTPEEQANRELVQKHGRILATPNHVGFDITNKCNLRCLHCYNRSGSEDFHRDEMTDDEVLAFTDQLLVLRPRSVCFCGGEPLLRKDLLIEVAKRLKQSDTNTAMVTNGLLMTPELAEELTEAGLIMIQFSLDGSEPATHDRLRGHPGAFDKTLSAMGILKQLGFRGMGIAFCPTAFNYHQAAATARIAAEYGAREFRVQPLMLLGRAVINRKEIMPNHDQYREMIRLLSDFQEQTSMKIEWGDPVDHLVRFPNLIPEAVPYLDIKSNGNITASAYLPISIGNVRRYPLTQYWDAGLARMWTSPLVQKLAGMIRSTYDFYRPDAPMPLVFYEEHLSVDLIENDLLGMSEQTAEQILIDHCARSGLDA